MLLEDGGERYITSCCRGPAAPALPQMLILAVWLGPPGPQEAITLFMASPHANPAARYWILWSGCSHTLLGVEGGTVPGGDVSAGFRV